jgi:type VII secretion-associated serine protease mycosin
MKPAILYRPAWRLVVRLAIAFALLPMGIGKTLLVSANPDVPTPYNQYFQAVNRDSTLYLTNPGSVQITVGLTPIPETFPPDFQIIVAANGTAAIPAANLKLSANQTYTVVASATTGPFQGAALFQDNELTPDGLAAYPGVAALQTSGIYGPVYAIPGQMTSEFYLFNPGADTTADLTFFNPDGAPVGANPIHLVLPAGKTTHLAAGAVPLSPLPIGFTGWMRYTAQNNVAILQLQRGSKTLEAAQPLSDAVIPGQPDAAAFPRLYKSYADGFGGKLRTTRIALVNTSPIGLSPTITLSPLGNPAQSIAKVIPTIPPSGLAWFDPGAYVDIPAGQAYSAIISSNAAFGAAEETTADSQPFPAAGYRLQGADSLLLTAIRRDSAAFTQLSIQNLSAQPAALTLNFLNADGTSVLSQTLSPLPAGASQLIDTRLLSLLGTAFAGSLQIHTPPGQMVSVSVDLYPTQSQPYYQINLPMLSYCNPDLYQSEPFYAEYQWDMGMIHADWAYQQCLLGKPGVIVAVIDSGVDLTHPDLAANILPGNDFVDGDNVPQDLNGHGTHVSGTIAAALNGIGIVGVAPNVKILPVRVLNSAGSGSTADVASGIIWAADHGASVINLSLGGAGDSSDVHAAVDYAIQKGVLIIAAAGNHAKTEPNIPTYPAAYPEVLTVAAVDSNNGHAYFSNFGGYVDVAAPGVSIFSTYMNGRYAIGDGTSMASPHVAGLAALIRSYHPDYSVLQVIDAIEKTAKSLGAGRPNTYYFGHGLIQVDKALEYVPVSSASAQSEPGAPDAAAPVDHRDQPIAAGHVIVRFRDGSDPASIQRDLASLGLQRSSEATNPILGERVGVQVGKEWQAIDSLRSLPEVSFAEPDYQVQAQ